MSQKMNSKKRFMRSSRKARTIGEAFNGRLYNILGCILDASFVDYLELTIPHSTIKFFPTIVPIITYRSPRLKIGLLHVYQFV